MFIGNQYCVCVTAAIVCVSPRPLLTTTTTKKHKNNGGYEKKGGARITLTRPQPFANPRRTGSAGRPRPQPEGVRAFAPARAREREPARSQTAAHNGPLRRASVCVCGARFRCVCALRARPQRGFKDPLIPGRQSRGGPPPQSVGDSARASGTESRSRCGNRRGDRCGRAQRCGDRALGEATEPAVPVPGTEPVVGAAPQESAPRAGGALPAPFLTPFYSVGTAVPAAPLQRVTVPAPRGLAV